MNDSKVKNTVPQEVQTIPPVKKLSIEEQHKRDSQPVRGVFKYHEVPNGVLRFSYRAYPQDQVQNYELFDGKIYSIPLGVAKHLNKNCWYPHFEYSFDKHGLPTQCLSKKIRRTSFQSLEFMDEDISAEENNILTIKQIQAAAL